MNTVQLKELIFDSYGVDAQNIEKIKNVYKIQTENKSFCLKTVKYEYGHFLFILSAIKHLQAKGFQSIPEIFESNKGLEYINLGYAYAYLTPWITARECNYDNPLDVKIAASKLADLHVKSQDFELTEDMKPRIGWFKWADNFAHKINEMLEFRKIILEKESLTEFDNLYLGILEDELERAESAIEDLKGSKYFEKMGLEINMRGFCHHDYANHNVLIAPDNSVNIIDFDYCMLDSSLHDLSSLLLRTMKNGKWDINTSRYIIENYNVINQIEAADIPIMAAFMEFPQDYWQVGIQYYFEKQPWGEEFFVRKIKRYIEDRGEKQEFLEDFKDFGWGCEF